MLNTQKIYIFNKTKFLKKGDHSDYWYRIEYLYLDKNNDLQYNYEFVSKDDFDSVVVCLDQRLFEDIPSYLFKGHFQNYKFKADLLIE